MPKIIENLPQRLLEETRRQIEEIGYGSLNIRTVAKNCGVGVGTVYNYYRSKDELAAAVLLEDWSVCVNNISTCSEQVETPECLLHTVYNELTAYVLRHRSLFHDMKAVTAYSGSLIRYHDLLRTQLAQSLRRFCRDGFMAEFIAESMLTWTVAGASFEAIYDLLRRLFDES